MLAGGDIIIAMTVAAAAPLDLVSSATVTSPVVTLGDVADLSSLPAGLRERAADLPVAAFRPGQTQIEFTSAKLTRRARTLVPALGQWFAAGGDDVIAVRLEGKLQPAAVPHAACLEPTRALAAGETVSTQDFRSASCGAEPALPSLRYDARSRAARAVRDLSPGDRIATAPASAFAAVKPGETLNVRTQAGPVVVEREVTALQTGWPGKPLFVRAADGAVLKAILPEDAQ